MGELGLGGAPSMRVHSSALLEARINVIYGIYHEESFRRGLLARNRKTALVAFFLLKSVHSYLHTRFNAESFLACITSFIAKLVAYVS
jgi:hypothetical protein